jgi:hypothetical protein
MTLTTAVTWTSNAACTIMALAPHSGNSSFSDGCNINNKITFDPTGPLPQQQQPPFFTRHLRGNVAQGRVPYLLLTSRNRSAILNKTTQVHQHALSQPPPHVTASHPTVLIVRTPPLIAPSLVCVPLPSVAIVTIPVPDVLLSLLDYCSLRLIVLFDSHVLLLFSSPCCLLPSIVSTLLLFFYPLLFS